MDDGALADRTLFHLSTCVDVAESFGETDAVELLGSKATPWPDLMASILDGLERGWVQEAHLARLGKSTRLDWFATNRGERAMRAFRARHAVEGKP